MFRRGKRTMRRQFSLLILSLTLITALIYTVLVDKSLTRGLKEMVQLSIQVEIQEFETRYASNPDTPLPDTGMLNFYIDDWRQAPSLYHEIIPFTDLQDGEYLDVDWSPNGDDDWEGSRYLLIYPHRLHDQRILYAVADFNADKISQEQRNEFDRLFDRGLYVGGVYVFLMILVVWLYGRRLTRRSDALAKWAEELSFEKLQQPVPDFYFHDLNQIANQLQTAFVRIADLLEKEHRFLRNASHELRTPIAVIKANMELLARMESSAPLQRPLERINRANASMQKLTETLLWISRDNNTPPKQENIVPAQLVSELMEDLGYLLENKPVELSFRENFTGHKFLPVTPLRIVLNNLLRNAFQHTQEGSIKIEINEHYLRIENHDEGATLTDSDNSFGLGIHLVEQICQKLHWELRLEYIEDGVIATLKWPEHIFTH
ncbi:sensor histidine kinase [Aliamphritea spongicola]|uniref:sensor histidine kinase n=1 Tax=Aliamphritea spongicola TaxID=707589 RepID=UPI00196A98D6|nr:HAMP domain-containing sensor histidine kinase [Aliamphritea spongicola]MBN3564079.1 HAMP domain-containing histidine kinase [Aliamphritea spongicola]